MAPALFWTQPTTAFIAYFTFLKIPPLDGVNTELELCADELVVGGGVGWSYDRRRRRRRRQTG